MEKTNETTAAKTVPPTNVAAHALANNYEATAPYITDRLRQAYESARQLARSMRTGFLAPEHLIMGILSSESPIIRAVRSEFMITPAELWPSLRERLPVEHLVSMCNGAPMTPSCKQIFADAIQTAHDANRKARVADFLIHFFDRANNGEPHNVGVLSILADFDLTQAPVVSFIKSHEYLEPPLPPDPTAPRPEPRVWKSATDRYADWRIRPAAQSPPNPPTD